MRTFLSGASLLVVSSLAGPAGASETITYTYDELGRLVETRTTPTSTVNANVVMSTGYDAAGNRTSYAVTGSTNMAAIEVVGAVALASVQTSGLGGADGDSRGWQARAFRPESSPDGRLTNERRTSASSELAAPTDSPF